VNSPKEFITRHLEKKTTPEVVYPCINVESFEKSLKSPPKFTIPSKKSIFLSLNRFDPNKKVEIAVDAFGLLCKKYPDKATNFQLVIAGGYDPHVQQNVNYLKQLQEQVKSHNLSQYQLSSGSQISKWNDESSVVFITDISEENKIQLLRSSLALLYTPSGEHFGIVPVEAMVSQCPVIAVASGGLLETVRKDKKVGLLCASDPKEFATAMDVLVSDLQKAREMGKNGKQRAVDCFSFDALASKLQAIVEEVTLEKKRK